MYLFSGQSIMEERAMPASLFTVPIGEITADDVNAFLDSDLEEGPRLDYKEADPAKVIPEDSVEVVCAFANTYGGLLILGVKADQITNRPILRDGLPLIKGLEERITSRCYDAIVPPISPEVKVCPFKSDPALPSEDKAFVVVRVSPSPAVPHALTKKIIAFMCV
jgi:predicted HTH transcriptional regulator